MKNFMKKEKKLKAKKNLYVLVRPFLKLDVHHVVSSIHTQQ